MRIKKFKNGDGATAGHREAVRKNYLPNKRIWILFLAFCVLFVAVFAKLLFVMIVQSEDLKAKAISQWLRDVPLEAPRGQILDRNGIVLADTSTLYSIYVRPTAVKEKEKVAAALSEEFGRGLTVINAKGFYSQTEKIVLYCVVNRFELSKLKSIVEQTDSQAFIAVSEVTDTLGSDLKFSLFKRKSNLEKIINQSQAEDSCEVSHVGTDEGQDILNDIPDGKSDNGNKNNKV